MCCAAAHYRNTKREISELCRRLPAISWSDAGREERLQHREEPDQAQETQVTKGQSQAARMQQLTLILHYYANHTLVTRDSKAIGLLALAEGQKMVEVCVRLVFCTAQWGTEVWGLPGCFRPKLHAKSRLVHAICRGRHLGTVHAQSTEKSSWSPAASALALGWETERKQKHEHQVWVWEGVQMAETGTSGRNVGSWQVPEILPLSV